MTHLTCGQVQKKMRAGTLDEYIFKEVRCYKPLNIGAKDVVLDIGANIGAFISLAADCGASLVVGYEPELDNYRLCCKNVATYGSRTAVVRAAVVRGNVESLTLYKNTGKNKGAHSVIPTRGREAVVVPAVSIVSILKKHKFTVLKVDCEGAEYEIFQDLVLPKHIRAIAIEYHLQKRGQPALAEKLHKWFCHLGFVPTKDVRVSTGLWHYTAIYHRGK